jgi:glycine cleavage system H protein
VFERDRSLGVMETAKTVVAVHAPISGRIVEVNEAVVGDVAPIEQDPYGAGWMFRIEPLDLAAEREFLLDAVAYVQWLAPRAEQKEAEKPIVDEFLEDLSIDPNRGY